MSYAETLREAIAHEKAGRWSAASDAWRRAAKALEGGARPVPEALSGRGGARHGAAGAARNAARCEAAGLRPGAVLRHLRWGVVKAECTYLGPTEIEYAGKVYGSFTAAARAAGADLGLSVTGGGWLFWGLEKAESPTFAHRARPELDEEENEAA